MKKFEGMVDINKAYSNVVADLLAGGATICAPTMNGSQGEISHVDLINVERTRVMRVLLERVSSFRDGCDHQLVIRVMSQTAENLGISDLEQLWQDSYLHATMWNDRGEEVFRRVWYGMRQGRNGKFHYTQDAEVPSKCQEVREYKYRNDLYLCHTYGNDSVPVNMDAVRVAKFVKAHGGRGYGNCKPEEIREVCKFHSTSKDRICYNIYFNSTKKALTF